MVPHRISLLVALSLIAGTLAAPLVAHADEGEPGTDCPNDKWELMALADVDPLVTDKAARRDGRGNADGSVCQRQKRNGKILVKDNNSSGDANDGETPPPRSCPGRKWHVTALGDVDASKADKAARRDAHGNNDGFVCQKQNKADRFQVKDNWVNLS